MGFHRRRNSYLYKQPHKMRFPNLAGFIPIVIIGSFVDLLNLKVLSFLKQML